MKRVKLLFLGLMLLVLSGSSNAMAIDLYGFGSYWDHADLDGVWGCGVGLSIPLFTEHVRLDGRAYFFEKIEITSEHDITNLPLDLGLQGHFLPNGIVDPYLLGGLSYVYVDSDRLDLDSNLGGYIGAGFDWKIDNSFVILFAEALYRFAEIDRNLGEDIDVSGFTGNVGVKLHF